MQHICEAFATASQLQHIFIKFAHQICQVAHRLCVCVCVCVQADVGELTSFYASLMQQVNRVLQPVHT